MPGIVGIGGSGLDIDAIVKKSVEAEKAPKQNQISKTEKSTTINITALGALRSAISEFQSALAELSKSSSFTVRSVSLSSKGHFTASAGSNVTTGSYKIEVTQLASSSKIALAAIPAGAKLDYGTLTIKVGSKIALEVNVDKSNNSLAGIRDAINKAGKEQGVSVTIINDASGSRLILSTTNTGAGNDISVSVKEGQRAGQQRLQRLAFAPGNGNAGSGDDGAKVISKAADALLTVDGLKLSSASNVVSNAIEGVTLTLTATTQKGSAVTLGIEKDEGAIKGNVKKFVESYNKLMGVIATQTKVTIVNNNSRPVAGALVGDATARTLTATIRNELVNMQGAGSVKALAHLGITTTKEGTLALDDAKLSKVVSEKSDDITDFFTSSRGLASRMKAKLDPYDKTGGILEQRNSALTDKLKKVDSQKAQLDMRMTELQVRLYKKYNAMDALYSRLSTTADSLLKSLASTPFARKD
ncbi:flagellar filament capping protein FliD [Pseudomonas oryzihabitans]|uniref:flagellar filament capping protein FliD n=1 Tax=Pseudomonas oryzihabitans TaxID=47885 RepID=UPI00285D3844|nr:flagellar filament capping protein FliD [Pseudomonas psychrotolerans]MDR6676590.1 flagellar hook-associated protein 2 [Pseudomonas psychrotolerans]